ncbi:hypothetical protein ACFLX9_02490 [Chloroflexota bacterium]
MEELLPGLLKMMDERLGRLGRPTTYIFLWLVILGIGSWMAKMFWDNAIWSLVEAIRALTEGTTFSWGQFVDILAAIGFVILACFTISYLVHIKITKKDRQQTAILSKLFLEHPEWLMAQKETFEQVKVVLLEAFAEGGEDIPQATEDFLKRYIATQQEWIDASKQHREGLENQ